MRVTTLVSALFMAALFCAPAMATDCIVAPDQKPAVGGSGLATAGYRDLDTHRFYAADALPSECRIKEPENGATRDAEGTDQ